VELRIELFYAIIPTLFLCFFSDLLSLHILVIMYSHGTGVGGIDWKYGLETDRSSDPSILLSAQRPSWNCESSGVGTGGPGRPLAPPNNQALYYSILYYTRRLIVLI